MMDMSSYNQSPAAAAVASVRRTPRLYPIIRCEILKFFNRRKLEQCKLISRRWNNTTSLHPSQFRARQRFQEFNMMGSFLSRQPNNLRWQDLPEFFDCCHEMKVGLIVILRRQQG